jgi:serine/threonine protein kinase
MQGVLANRYRLERQLGKGGMGSVWLAEHLALRSWVAVKLMDPAIAATPEGAERFRREAQAAASLRSAHVVQVLDYGVHEATPFLVMELMHGESLAGCLEREKRLTPERTLTIMTQVSRALGRAHAAGIVHRDLKPDNIFLVKEDDQELVKILDFGIAKTPQSTFGGMETRTGVTMGTPYYMSPEQVEGKRAVDFRTDLWAMAVITCECMTGVRPFDGSTFGELLLNICARPIAPPSSQGLLLPGFDAWFAKATNRDAEQRFASAQELAATLGDVVRGAAGHAFASPVPAAAGVPAPTPPYVPAATGGQSAPSINTAQALELSTRSSGRSALPWILLGVVVTVSSAGAGVGAEE